jgi:hypothetical protein
MRGSGERHTQTTADREIGGYAHWTLRHQRKRNTGKSPRGCAARSPREPPLPQWLHGRGSISSARAHRMRVRIVHLRHACASSCWQQDESTGLSSY